MDQLFSENLGIKDLSKATSSSTTAPRNLTPPPVPPPTPPQSPEPAQTKAPGQPLQQLWTQSRSST